jgi:hypothetical protein
MTVAMTAAVMDRMRVGNWGQMKAGMLARRTVVGLVASMDFPWVAWSVK